MNDTPISVPAAHTFTRDEIINTIIIRISEESGRPVTLDSALADDLDLDSLDYVNLAQILEAEFAIGPLPDSDLFKLQTVDQVVCYVTAWLQQKAEIASAVAANG